MGTFLRVIGGAILVTSYFLPSVSCGPARYSQFQVAANEGGAGPVVAFMALVLYGLWTMLGPAVEGRGSKLSEGVQMALTLAAAAAVGYFIYQANERHCRLLWPIGAQVMGVFVIFIGSLLRYRGRTRW